MFGFKARRRKRLMTQELPAERLAIVRRNVPFVRHLAPLEQRRLQGLIQVFLDEKRFEGCGGLKVTDEIRLTVAAQACMLLLGLEGDFYPTLRTILVYPHSYVAQLKQRGGDGIVVEGPQPRRGESWSHGAVVLSWDDVLKGASDIHDGHNLVFHEFAHQLDLESGAAEGAPLLEKRSLYIAWSRVLGKEYADLIDHVVHHRRALLDAYGATSPAEFFAVATECFFEKPVELKAKHPELYEQLMLFYRQDPARFAGSE